MLGGLVVALILAVYLSRRLTRPVLALSRVADEVAQGNYDVSVPEVRAAARWAFSPSASARWRDGSARRNNSNATS